jgi:EAL domain-containing protein (putative c-di-GMP-specific phosphodiesterase class I)/DNA-binding NarL/FixJ family response regulator
MINKELKILVVEDDDFQRAIIVKMLYSLEITSVLEASNGEQALDIIKSQKEKSINIIITDLKMPKMDGIELLRSINTHKQESEVIILSGMDRKLLAAAGQISKLNDIKLLGTIEKPVTLSQLYNLLNQYGNPSLKANTPTSSQLTFSVKEIMEGVRNKQFKPYLQPKVNLKTGKVVGAEALARWIHPIHGVVAPYAFIPTLEQNNSIDELTFLMLEESAIACKELLKQNHALNIAVNLSLVSLNNSDIANTIIEIFNKANVDPKYVSLEITESAAMTDGAIPLENLARLYMSGFTLSIDDYGTGYSNLQQLTRIAFGELKIDQSFVQGFASNDKLLIVVAANVDMAHKLGIKSVAEGVETKEDWEMLKSMDCDIAQGYYIAKPMPVEDFYNFVADYEADIPEPTVINNKKNTKKYKTSNADYKMLVVEDDEFTRNIITQVLSNLGYLNIESASDARSAINLFRDHRFDIIITDILMPNINGLELIKSIRTGKTLAKPESRIIVLSGMTEASAVGKAIALDVNGILVKPLVASVVDQKINHVLSTPFKINSSIAYEAVSTDITESENAKSNNNNDLASLVDSLASQPTSPTVRPPIR